MFKQKLEKKTVITIKVVLEGGVRLRGHLSVIVLGV